MQYSDLKNELRANDLKGDPWGCSMIAWFDVAAELAYRGADVPAHWDYRPSPICPDDPREPESLFAEIAAEAGTEDLIRFGYLLERYTRRLERAGMSY